VSRVVPISHQSQGASARAAREDAPFLRTLLLNPSVYNRSENLPSKPKSFLDCQVPDIRSLIRQNHETIPLPSCSYAWRAVWGMRYSGFIFDVLFGSVKACPGPRCVRSADEGWRQDCACTSQRCSHSFRMWNKPLCRVWASERLTIWTIGVSCRRWYPQKNARASS
jgi:hypothetical protein